MNWNAKTLYERVVDRWGQLDSKYAKINRNRDIIVDYFRCDELLEVDNSGNLLGSQIYNASGMWYSQMMARGFQGSLVSKNIPWIDYQLDQYELQGIDPLDEWCQMVKDYMVDDYQRGNFYDVQPQFTLDGITIGSPVMFGEEDIVNRRTMWTPVHYKNVRVFYNRFNEAEGVIVKDTQWTAKQIFDTFIKEDDDNKTRSKAKLPTSVNEALEGGRLSEDFTVYRAVFKSSDPIWEGGWKKPKGDWQWYSVYFCEIKDKDAKTSEPLNDNIGYFAQPFVVWDYDKKPWEASSRTPAWYAIWDNLSLQQIDKNYLENMQLKNRPPRYALDTMRGRLDFSPEGENYMSSQEYASPPRAMDMIGDISLNEHMVNLNEEKIRRWFMADLWTKFSDLVRTNKQPVTAAQIWQMVAEKATLLSPAIESHSRYLSTCDTRMINVALRRGEYPFDMESMSDVSEQVQSNSRRPVNRIRIAPVFVGALAQAQKRNQQLEPITAGIAAASGLLQIFPDLKLAIKDYDTLDDMFQAVGFPQKNIRTKEDYDKLVDALNEARAQQQQFANSLEAAKAAKNVSGPVDQSSILGSVAGAA